MTHAAARPWHVLCCCGWSGFYAGETSALNAAAWHRSVGCEGCDHVTAVEYVPPGERR